jgi:uncharacterized alpha-E superfamily protein
MLSRVADSLYWMSRYLERAENTVRQLDVTMSLLLDSSETSADTRWQRLLTSLGNPEGVEWTGDADAMTRRDIAVLRLGVEGCCGQSDCERHGTSCLAHGHCH